MSIVRSPELGGLTDRKVRAAMFYSKKRRLERIRVGAIITGTAPVLAALANGNLLTNSVTWSLVGDGVDPVIRQMKVDNGSWVTFHSGQLVSTGEQWTVREYLQDILGNKKLFTSNTQEVTA